MRCFPVALWALLGAVCPAAFADGAAGPAAPQVPAPPKPGARTDRYGDPLPANALARLGTTRLRASEHIVAAALSPDGKVCALTGNRMDVHVFDVASGKHLRALKVGFL